MCLELKKTIMRLVNSPEWEYHKELVQLLEQRSQLDNEIAKLISNENLVKSSAPLQQLAHH